MDVRRLILDDLTWLNALGPLVQTDDLTRSLGLPTSITGSDLLGWLLMHVSGVAVSWCYQPAAVPVFVQAGRVWVEPCDDDNVAFVINGHEGALFRYAVLGNRTVLSAARDHSVVFFTSFIERTGTTLADRVERLGTLFHEAHHICCDNGHDPRTPQSFYRFDDEVADRDHFDRGLGGAYTAQALLIEALAENCRCSRDEQVALFALAPWERIDVLLPRRLIIPSDGPFAGDTFFAGRVIDAVPPFAAYERFRSSMSPIGQALVDLFEAAMRESPNAFLSWTEVPSRPVSVPLADWPAVWLARALRSEAEGYNVPTALVHSCAESVIGCDSAPLLVQNGVPATLNLSGRRENFMVFDIGPDGAGFLELRATSDLPAGTIGFGVLGPSGGLGYFPGNPHPQITRQLEPGRYSVIVFDDRTTPTQQNITVTATWSSGPPAPTAAK